MIVSLGPQLGAVEEGIFEPPVRRSRSSARQSGQVATSGEITDLPRADGLARLDPEPAIPTRGARCPTSGNPIRARGGGRSESSATNRSRTAELPLELDPHDAGLVPHRPGQTESDREVVDEGSEPDPLDDAMDEDCSTFDGNGSDSRSGAELWTEENASRPAQPHPIIAAGAREGSQSTRWSAPRRLSTPKARSRPT